MVADLGNRFRNFWLARNARERWLLTLGGSVLLCAILYGAIYAPIGAAHRKLSDRLPQLRAQHRLLIAQVEEIERIRRDPSMRSAVEVGLERRIRSSVVAGSLQDGIVSITVIGGDQIQVVTRDRPVNVWLGWMLELQRQGVQVKTARMRLSEKEGLARLEVTFAGAQP
jgi:general secretion pathway protein M